MGDLLVVLVIAVCLLAVVRYHLKKRKTGETGCGCGCSSCSSKCGTKK